MLNSMPHIPTIPTVMLTVRPEKLGELRHYYTTARRLWEAGPGREVVPWEHHLLEALTRQDPCILSEALWTYAVHIMPHLEDTVTVTRP